MRKSVLFIKQNDKENKKEKEKEKELLNKKRAELDTPQNDIDMVKLKKKINEIIGTLSVSNNIIENNSIDSIYQSMHKNYILKEFTSNCINYINKIIIDVKKNHLKKFQGIFELNKLFISIIKELLMNEFEILLLSLYLESINLGLNIDIFTFEESLIYLCYFIKKLTLTNENLSPINSFLIRKYQGFEDKFNKWFQINSLVFNNKLYFSYAEINERFKEYSIPYSIYCRNNYIDYNLLIDRILSMSIPYNEKKTANLLMDKNENSNDLLLGNNNKNNINMNTINNYSENINNLNNLLLASSNNYNNINNLYNPNYISNYPTGIYMNSNNSNINLDNTLNRNNIIFSAINNEAKSNMSQIIQQQFNNKELLSNKLDESKNKTNLNYKVNNLNEVNNISCSSSNEGNNKNKNKSKYIFITDSKDSKKADIMKLGTDNNNNNKNTQKNKKITKKEKQEMPIIPNNSLHSLENIDETPQNNKIDNNIHFNSFEKLNNQIKNNNDSINNMTNINNINNINNIIKNNEGINANQNNIIGLQLNKNMNDFNILNYNNIGLNDFNNINQASLTFPKNSFYPDINNLYHNLFNGITHEDNFKQLLNKSNENFFRSCLSINSSRNLFPILNNINYDNNIGENEHINNLNYQPISQIMEGNPSISNINVGLNGNINNINYGKNGMNQDKQVDMINNIKNNDNNNNNNENNNNNNNNNNDNNNEK